MKINRNAFINISVVSFVAFAIAVLFSNLAYGAASKLAYTTSGKNTINEIDDEEAEFVAKGMYTLEHKDEDLFSYEDKKQLTENELKEQLKSYKSTYLDRISPLIKGTSCDYNKVENEGTLYLNGVKESLGQANISEASKKNFLDDASNTESEQRAKCNLINQEQTCTSAGNLWKDNTCKKAGDHCTVKTGEGVGTYKKTDKGWKCKLKECKADGYWVDAKDDGYSCTRFEYKKQKTDEEIKNEEKKKKLENLKQEYLQKTEQYIKDNYNCGTIKTTGLTYKDQVHTLLTTEYSDYTTQSERENIELDVSNTINVQEKKCNSADEKKKCDEAGNLWKDNTCKKVGDPCTDKRGEGVGTYEKTAKGWKCKLDKCNAEGYYVDAKADGYSCTRFEYKKQKTDEEKKADEYKAKMQELKQNYLNGLKDVVKSPNCDSKKLNKRNEIYKNGYAGYQSYEQYLSKEEQTKIKVEMDKTISEQTEKCKQINTCTNDGNLWKDNKCTKQDDDWDKKIKISYDDTIAKALNKNCDKKALESLFTKFQQETDNFNTTNKVKDAKQKERKKYIETTKKEKLKVCESIIGFKQDVGKISNAYNTQLDNIRLAYAEEERKIAAEKEKALKQQLAKKQAEQTVVSGQIPKEEPKDEQGNGENSGKGKGKA